MASCDIKFDSPEGIYYAGQSLSAQIELKLTKPKKLRSKHCTDFCSPIGEPHSHFRPSLSFAGIYIIIKGRAKCNWIKKYRAHRKTRSVAFEGEENYLETVTYLRGNDHSEPVELPPGIHTFHAACVLPTHLPTSFEGTVGQIRYFAKVVIDRPWKFDHTFKRAFTVIRQYDLNYESSLRLPVELHRINTLCCFPCRSGPFKWTVKLPVGGFAPGQRIPIHIDIVNHSGTTIKHFRLRLRRIVLYHATNPKAKTRREKEEVMNYKLQEKAVDYGDTHVEHALDIPAIPPSNIMNSAVVQVTYELKVSAVTAGLHDDIEMKIPIVIGTVPLYPIPLNPGQMSPGDSGVQPINNPNYRKFIMRGLLIFATF